MRVLHVNAGNLYGGIETLLVTLARCRHLCPEMEPSFALCFEGRLSEELAEAGVPVHILGNVRISRVWTVLKARQVFQRLVKRQAFDIVLTHGSWSHAIFGPVTRKANIPLANWIHGIPSARNWLERWASRTPPDLAICNSQFTAGHADKLLAGVPKEILYYPVAAPLISKTHRFAVRRELGAHEDNLVILQVSRMEAWKGHESLLNALKRLQDLPNWICWIAGGAQRAEERHYLDALQSLATQLGIADRVMFLGQRSDIPKLMAAADVFCQPNRDGEPFGIVFIEALFPHKEGLWIHWD